MWSLSLTKKKKYPSYGEVSMFQLLFDGLQNDIKDLEGKVDKLQEEKSSMMTELQQAKTSSAASKYVTWNPLQNLSQSFIGPCVQLYSPSQSGI